MQTNMPSGMDYMLKAVLRLAKVDPEIIIGQAMQAMNIMTKGFQEAAGAMQAIQLEQAEQRKMLEHIMRELHIAPPDNTVPVAMISETQPPKGN